MEPVSIASAIVGVSKLAKTAWDVGETLRNFISDTKNVNNTVTDLQSEARGLGKACDVVRKQLEDLRDEYEQELTDRIKGKAHEDPLWTSFSSELGAIKRTMKRFSRTLAELDGEKSSFTGRAWKQYKLDGKIPEIAELRSRVRSHTAALQMIMLSITM